MNRPETNYVAEQIEKLLDEFTFDFQADVLELVFARLPKRQREYEQEIDRDNALGDLNSSISNSSLSLREQSQVLRRMKCDFLRSNV